MGGNVARHEHDLKDAGVEWRKILKWILEK
jgi:hypothetical protein